MKTIAAVLCLLSSPLLSEESDKPDVGKISEAFGHLIGKNLQSMGLNFDVAQVVKGLQDASQGHESPMTETEWVKAVTAAQETALKETADKNLKHAEEFLAENKAAPGVQTLEEGKLQYKIEKEGAGPIVDESCVPLVRYTGKFLDGTVFEASPEEDRIDIAEEPLIPGFRQALIGMKQGEKRTVYIHPDLGFKNKDTHINSLIIYEIEAVKAHTNPQQPIDDVTHTMPPSKHNPEIAHKDIR